MPFHLSDEQLQKYVEKGSRNEKHMAINVLSYKKTGDKEAKRKAMVFFKFLPKVKRAEIEKLEKKP